MIFTTDSLGFAVNAHATCQPLHDGGTQCGKLPCWRCGPFHRGRPMLLQAGLCRQAVPRTPKDWWAEYVNNELAGPIVTLTPGYVVSNGPPTQPIPTPPPTVEENWWAEVAESKLTYAPPHAGLPQHADLETVQPQEVAIQQTPHYARKAYQ